MSVFEFQKMRFKELKALTGRGTGCSEKKSKVSRQNGWNLLQYYFNHIDVYNETVPPIEAGPLLIVSIILYFLKKIKLIIDP